MLGFYREQHQKLFSNAHQLFANIHDTNILVTLATTSSDLAAQDATGQPKLLQLFEALLAAHLETSMVFDAVLPQNQTQRASFWGRRK